MTSDGVEIRQIRREDIESFHACMDSIAKERIYLERLEAYPLEATNDFILNKIEKGIPHFVALIEGKVIGWCDIFPLPLEVYKHRGVLGMGVLKDYRNQDIGTSLLSAALDAASRLGLERVDLEVFSSNTVAIHLYKQFGFEVEGVKKRAKKLDEIYDDLVCMALFLTD